VSVQDDIWTARLRAAVEDHPAAVSFDPATYVAAGRRRRQRNQLVAASGSALAVAVVVSGLTLATGWHRSGEPPVPPVTQTPTPTATTTSPVPAGAPVGAVTLGDTGEGFFAVLDSGQVWRRDADGWHQLGTPADGAGMVFAPNGQQLWTYDQESTDGGRSWHPLSRAQDESCSPVPSVATTRVFLLMPRWCQGTTPEGGSWQGPAYAQVLGTDRWEKRELPPLLQDANPGFGPPRFLTVGDDIVATTDPPSVGHQYVVSRDGGASWEAPVTYPCDNGELETDPDHTALLAVCPGEQGASVWRATDLTHWVRVADATGLAASSGTTWAPLGPETWLFVDVRDRSATLVTPDGPTNVEWPDGLGVTGVASIGADLYVATVEMARNGAGGDYGGIYVSHDNGRTWARDD
jgi:hypothetical protein